MKIKLFNKEKQFKNNSLEQNEKNKKYEDYNNYINSLKEKSKNAIRISKKADDLIFLGEYAEEYPEIHIVEIYEDSNKTVYRLDKR